MRHGGGSSPWGAPSWECPLCPVLETKRPGRRKLRAEGIQWHLVHLSARRERLPLTFSSRAEPGQPAAVAAGGRAGVGGEAERMGAVRELAPAPVPDAESRPRRPGPGDACAPARRPTSSIPQ